MSDGQDCTQIPAIIAGNDNFSSLHSCSGSFFHDVYKDMSNKVGKVWVTDTDGTPDSGTAFFVGDGTHMVTNSHVVSQAREIHISTQGKDYSAVVEKLDDKNDLAELKIVGIDADPSRAVKMNKPASLAVGDPVVSVGVPVKEHELFLNPGTIDNISSLYKILKAPTVSANADASQIEAAYHNGTNADLANDAKAVADSPRLIVNQGARHGDSGSPLVDADENLVGVVTSMNANNATIDVPYTKVQALLAQPEPTFNFNYKVQSEFVMPQPRDLAIDGAGVVATAAGALAKGRFLPLAYGVAKGASLVSEINQLTHASLPGEKEDLTKKIAEDAGIMGGGLATTLLWKSPVGRAVGAGVLGLSLAARFVSDAQDKHYLLNDISRKNGDTRGPWIFKN